MFASHILRLATERMSLIKAQGMESMAILLPILCQICKCPCVFQWYLSG